MSSRDLHGPDGLASFVQVLARRAEEQPDQEAYLFLPDQGSSGPWLTWAGLEQRARAIAVELRARGMAGERALLLFPSGLDFIAAFFGCLYAGVVAVPAYPPRRNRPDARLSSILRDCTPRLVLALSELVERRAPVIAHNPDLREVEWLAVDRVSNERAGEWRDPGVTRDTLAFLQYTSGSTSSPKGVMVSHGNLLHNEEAIRLGFAQSAESVVVGWLPLYHDMGLIGNVLQPLYLGARCVLMSPLSFLQRPLRWLETISRYRGTTSGGPSFAYDLCVRKSREEDRAGLDLSCWTLAFNGAEPVRAETLERFAGVFASSGFRREAFYPCYGLAEATLFVSGGRAGTAPAIGSFEGAALERDQVREAAPAAPSSRSLVGCGSAWGGNRLRIVEPESLVPRAVSQVGEIWVAGPSVAQGYWNRPEATETLFRARLDGDPDRFLRTGDLGFIAGGELFITGRLKDLIILRGRNLYPQDIERTAEESHPALRRGNGAAFSIELIGEERLVIVQELERGGEAQAGAAAEAIRQAVAESHEAQVHEVVLVRTGTIPKTTSGKIRRGACRTLYQAGELEVVGRSAAGAEDERVSLTAEALLTLAPEHRREALEQSLKGAIARLARVAPSEIERDRPLLASGLDSLTAAELRYEMERDFGVDVPLIELLDGVSLAGLTDGVLRRLRESPAETLLSTSSFAADDGALSRGEKGLWLLQSLAPDSSAYNLAAAARLDGELRPSSLRRALEALVARHAALRTTFDESAESQGEPRRRVHPEMPVDFLVEDAVSWSEALLRTRLEKEAYRPFDLRRGPLLRVRLYTGPGHCQILLLAVHHIVSDFWSLAVMLRDLAPLYAEANGGGAAGLAPLAWSHGDHVRRQEERLAGESGERSWAYWRDRLSGDLPVLDLPTDHPRSRAHVRRGAVRTSRLDPALTEALEALGREHGATLFMVLLAAFQTLLGRYTGQEELLIGSPTAGRETPGSRGLIGYFVNPVPLRTNLSGDPPWSGLLGQVRAAVLESLEHQGYPLPLLAERLQPVRDGDRPPFFQATFALHKAPRPEEEALAAFALREAGVRLPWGGVALESMGLVPREVPFDLTFMTAKIGGGLGAAMEYEATLFDSPTISRLLGHFARILRGIAADPGQRLSALPWLADAEAAQVRLEWNDTATGYPRDRSIHELFAEWVERTPEAVAVEFSGQRLTYRELDDRAERLAHHLRSLGVALETPVAICVERSADLVVGLLGILKSGGFYVPLEPDDPEERKAWILAATGAPVVLVRKDRPVSLPGACLVIALDALPETAGRTGAAEPRRSGTADCLAYVIYTSGSTGRPKGVAVPHRAVVRLVRDTDYVQLDTSSRVAQAATAAFDAATFEIWGALLNGGCVVGIEKEVVLSPWNLAEALAEQRIDTLFLTTAVFHQVAREVPGGFRTLRHLLFGGEAIDPVRVRAVLEEGAPRRLLHVYGPTETTTFATWQPVGSAQVGSTVPIGLPIANSRIHVLDRGFNPQPAGVPGELYLGGDGLARGYLGRPDLTADRFVPDPFAIDPGERLYRTGDRVRHLANGALEFLGRFDHQVKIRGFRIEPGEIEAALLVHPAVQEALVIARDDARGERRLVAYVAANTMPAPSPGELRSFLQRSLPEAMVPAVWAILPKLPLNANGKVDRRALPEPEEAAVEERLAPRTVTEELLAMIWGEVLGVDTVGPDQSFFDLGGHSLLAIQVVSRIRETFGVEVPLRGLFETSTLAELAALVDQAVRTEPSNAAPPLEKVPRSTLIPLSFSQQRLWFLDQWQPGGAAYNMPGALRIRGRLRREILDWTLAEIVRRHESLRTTFTASGGEPAQVVHPPAPRAVPLVDLSALPEPIRAVEARRLAVAEARRCFDLQQGPLWRLTLLRSGEDDHVLLATMHHIVSDAWSLSILMRELGTLYRAGWEGVPSPLPEPPVQYADFAVWQRRWLAGARLDSEVEHWRARLAGSPPVLELPSDRPRPAVQSYRGQSRRFELSAHLAGALDTLGRREQATPFMVLLAAFQALLARVTGREDVSVGSPTAGRNHLEIEGLIGFFVNTLVLRTDLAGDPTFRELLARVRARALEAHTHQDLPFEKLVDELAPERSLSHSPLIQVMFVLQSAPLGAPDLPETEASLLPSESGTAKFDLLLELSRGATGLLGVIEYATDLFDAVTIIRFSEHFATLLEGALASPELRLADLPLLSAAEEHQLVLGWNDTVTPVPAASLDRLFAAQAERSPEAVAVVADEVSWTYGELSRRVGRLARRLRRLGVGPEVRVAVCLERSPELVLALHSIVRAGGAYVPLDPDYPRERLAFMLSDACPAVLLSSEPLRDRLPEHGVPTVWLDQEAAAVEAESGEDLAGGFVDDRQLAYMIYTSGSTGRPKGAMVSHGGICNRLLWMQDAYPLTSADAVLQKTPFSFDVSVWEFFWPLLAGARLVVARPGGHRDGAYLVDVIERQKISVLHFVPSMLRAFLDEPDLHRCRSLRKVVVSGEALGKDLEKLFFERLPADLENLYGPTEASVDVTVWSCRPEVPRASVPIGRPIANTSIYVLDRGSRPVPPGVQGELYIGGVSVGRGYCGRPELTGEKFVPDPFGDAGSRLYRTGDLVRHAPDGTVEYLGRIDHQVKIRGFRIELGEIEAVLALHPSVREAAVLAREDTSGDRRLVAYVATSPEESSPTAAALRGFLREELPEHMIPSTVVFLPELPLTPNGKLDRRALPAPEGARSAEGRTDPRTMTEQLLAMIWCEVLGAREVGVEESFFELGGHSLLATQVVSRIRETFGVSLPLRALFNKPTVEALSATLDEALRQGRVEETAPILRLPRTERMPLSFAQQRLWFLEQWEPGRAVYNLPGALRLHGLLRVEALEWAIEAIVRRHESLRTVFREVDGEPSQVILPEAPRTLPVVDLEALPEAVREMETARLAAQEARRGFDLERGPLFRLTLVRLRDGDSALLTTMHHIVSDAWSTSILTRELGTLYRAAVAGEPSPLAELPVQYADFAGWQRHWLGGSRLDAEMEYWRGQLATSPPILELPADRPRPAFQRFHGERQDSDLSERLTESVEGLGRRERATPFMVLLAAFQALLSRLTGREDVSVGTPIAGRNRLEIEGLIGFFVNTLVLRTDLSGDPSFRELLARVRAMALEAHAHQDLPFERLVDEMAPERSLGHSPLVQVVFSLHNAALEVPDLPGVESSLLPSGSGTAKFDLVLELSRGGAGLRGVIEYATDLFDAVTIRRFSEHFAALLGGALAAPELRLSDLPLLSEAEAHQLLVGWNDTLSPMPPASLNGLFAAQVERSPEAPAVVMDGVSWTYRELSRRVNQLARRLRRLGVGPEVRVAVCLERSPELVLALHAVVKAGGAYVPLDPDYPRERLAFMLSDARPAVLLSSEPLRDRLPETGVQTVWLDSEEAALRAESGEEPAGWLVDDLQLAYMIYTSGSTGRPKGAMVSHRGICNRLLWMQQAYRLTAADAVLQKTPFSFDVSVWEFFWPLLTGARLVVARPGGHRDGAYLVDVIEREKVSVLHFVPSMLRAFLDEPDLDRCRSLRKVVVSGEALGADLEKLCFERLPVDLENLYGPTEASVDVTVWGCRPGAARASVPIGRPIANTSIYVLDRGGRPVPLGVSGELSIGGANVGRGYLGRPELTAEKFVPDPFGAPGSRLYRTGDLVRHAADGAIEFLGRLDHQIKIRGFRIELGEIEAALSRHPGVREGAVLAREDSPGDRRLVAYVAARPESTPTAAELRGFLREELPEHAIPSAVVFLPELPLSPNGKLDRRALPAPERSAPRENRGEGPRTPMEQALAAIWCEVLGTERVATDDNFFELGGHSLLGMQVVSRARRMLGVEIAIRNLFETPTLAGLAAACERYRRGEKADAARLAPTPLSAAQRRLWHLDRQAPGGRPVDHLPVALRLEGCFRPEVLEQALSEIVRRHESLRTTFVSVDGEPAQAVGPALPCSVPLVDLTGLAGLAEAAPAEARRLAREEALRPFDLERGPLLRVTLLRLGGEEHLALLTLHRIVGDDESTRLLSHEITVLREAFAAGRPSPLQSLPVQYADFARWQSGWLRGEASATQAAFWRRRLAGLPPRLGLAAHRPRPGTPSFRAERRPLALAPDLGRLLRTLGSQEGVGTPFMVLLAAWQVLLWRHTGQDLFLLGIPITGRHHPGVQNAIGCFAGLLPLRADLAGNPTFQELLGRVRETVREAQAHQDLPFERLVEDLRWESRPGDHPLVQATFSLAEGPASPPALSRPALEATELDLALRLGDEGEGFSGSLQYRVDLLDGEVVSRMLDHYVLILAHAAARPSCRLAELAEILAEAETQQRIAQHRARREELRPQLAGVRRPARRAAAPDEAR